MKELWFLIHTHLDRLSLPGNGNRIQRYGLVFLLTGIFFTIKTALTNALGIDVPFLFSLFIVILSAWFGGFGPGIIATLLTGTLTYIFFLDPKFTFFGSRNVPNFLVLIIFFLESLFISILSESHRKNDTQKSEFIGIISHELKNPLTSITGYAQMIQRITHKKGDVKLEEFAGRIDSQVKQVIIMINEMLDITKIETGRLTYQDEPFNIGELVKEIINDQQVTTNTHKISLTAGKGAVIVGDRYRIGQVITNLISNAIKYSPYAHKVTVKVENKKNDIIISVRDFGFGIDKKDRNKLFDPFFRAQNTQRAKGTGIGLFISAQIVKRHKGKLRVKSEENRGSTFIVSLPKNSS